MVPDTFACVQEFLSGSDSMKDLIQDLQKMEALKDYKSNLLLIGINYYKKTKKHERRIEKYLDT